MAAIYVVTMLTALLVVLTPLSASAECAWVLWTEIVSDNSQNFRATSGWPDKETCEAQ